jgi:glycosyltransferase involved in cell wall biosynthesis
MKVAVAQLGARRHYLLPRALDERRMLSRFHTDLYIKYRAVGRLARNLGKVIPLHSFQRLGSRSNSDLEPVRVSSYPFFGLRYKLRARRSRSQTELTRTWLWGGQRFCELVAGTGFDDADTVYAYTSAAEHLFELAKLAGLRCVLDHATAPKFYEDNLVNDEIGRRPGWVNGLIRDDCAEEYTARQRHEWELADLIVCGSSFVRESIRHMGGPVEKTAVVPLGFANVPQTYPGRDNSCARVLNVLLVGDDVMRKGIGDFVEAIRLAGTDRFKGRVVGNAKLSEYGRQKAGEVVELVGAVPQSEMSAQYRWADIFVLPSLSDTFGLVILEAMAHGVPVIATHNTGAPDILREGVDGFIVPVRSPELIAGRLERLASDRKLLREMSVSSFDRCRQFNLQGYSMNLIETLKRRLDAAN